LNQWTSTCQSTDPYIKKPALPNSSNNYWKQAQDVVVY